MARTFSGALVPAVNADGSVQWQSWQYDELLAHLNLDLQLDASALTLGGGLIGTRGQATLTWPGGSPFSNSLVVPHGLSVIPQAPVATAQLAPGTAAVEMHWVSADVNAVTWRGHTTDGSSPPNTATTLFSWVVAP